MDSRIKLAPLQTDSNIFVKGMNTTKNGQSRTSMGGIDSAMNFNKQALNDKSSTTLNMKVSNED
jgi:hypothetical protein